MTPEDAADEALRSGELRRAGINDPEITALLALPGIQDGYEQRWGRRPQKD